MRLVFSLVLGIFIVCVTLTLTSFPEMPLDILTASQAFGQAGRRKSSVYAKFIPDPDAAGHDNVEMGKVKPTYGSFEHSSSVDHGGGEQQKHVPGNPFAKQVGGQSYLKSVLDFLPRSVTRC